MKHSQEHLFALHCSTLGEHLEHCSRENIISIINQELWHRITHILRLEAGNSIQLFDSCRCASITLEPQTFSSKKMIVGLVSSVTPITQLKPVITVYQGLTKKEAFEDIVYAAAQLGVTTLQPIICDKTQRAWYGDKDFQRLANIMVAGCEQSKQFMLPTINSPITFKDALLSLDQQTHTVAFETDGKPLSFLFEKILVTKTQPLAIFIGPEGGFCEREITLFQQNNIERYKLTPTILRSQEAFLVAVGMLRCI